MKKLLYISALALLFSHPAPVFAETFDKEDALKQALQNNPSYMVVLANIDVAAGARLQASLPPNPDAVLEIENFAGDKQREGFDEAEITLGLAQKIELGGKRKNRTKVADFEHKIAQKEALTQAFKLLSETEYAFIRMAVAQERVALSNKRLELADQTHDIVKKRIGAAKSAEIQHTKADIEKASAEVEKRNAEKDYRAARNDLARLLGLEKSDNLMIDADLSVLPELVDRQTLINALSEIPQARIQEFVKMQARYSLDLARASGVPDPTLGIGVRRFNDSDGTALVASLSFPMPVFNRNQGGIQIARANIVQAEEQARAAKLSLNQAAVQAWETLAVNLEETRRYKGDIIPSAQKAYTQADKGYSRGAFTFLDLLDAQRTLNDVQTGYLDSILRLYEAKAQTDFLMGSYGDLVIQLSQTNTQGETNNE